jgi:hypothetical protein
VRRTTGEETDFTDDTGVCEGPTLSIPIKNMTAIHRHERHDRHTSDEAACPSRFLGDDDRNGGVTVIGAPGEAPSRGNRIAKGSMTTVTVMTVNAEIF